VLVVEAVKEIGVEIRELFFFDVGQKNLIQLGYRETHNQTILGSQIFRDLIIDA